MNLDELDEGFTWGVATAAYQIEGSPSADGKGPSIWDTFTHKRNRLGRGPIKDGSTGDIATDSYRRYPDDIALTAAMGFDAYRFSLSWPRICPDGDGRINQAGLEAREDIILEYTHDPQLVRQYDPAVMNLVEKVTAYKLQTRALDEARMGNVAGATQKLRAAATRLLELGETDLAQAAKTEADNLERSGQMTAAGTKKLRYQTRKLTQRLPELPEDQ